MINNSDKIFLKAFKGQPTPRSPFWFMRQAGRYLPEYKSLRKEARNFLEFCYTPAMAVEASLQPIRRFGMDAAIIFSDILVIPDALGMDVQFVENIGPVLTPLCDEDALNQLDTDGFADKLNPVYEAIRQTRAALSAEKALIGFAGAPWTLACYITEGRGSRDFQAVRSLTLTQPQFFGKLIAVLTDAVITHASRQIEAGADAIQLFDSWAGCLSESGFARWVIEPTARIVQALKARHPGIPLIGFPRLAGCGYASYAASTAVDGVSVDAAVPLEWAAHELQHRCVVQGNLDPVLLAADEALMLKQAKKITSTFGKKNFVFNLGHGILPHTPLGHVQHLCDFLREA